ncbi:MAG: NAD(P)H-dependent glycerol-3-phosphate dehydrogenase [Planctomycetota bacterium]
MSLHLCKEVAVLGNGGFGTALACYARSLGHGVRLWGHDPDYTLRIRETRDNPRYLPGIRIPETIEISSNESPVLRGAELVLSVVPTQHLRATLGPLAPGIPEGVPIVSCSKGMEQESGVLPSRIIQDVVPRCPIFVLSGPCHAEELVRGKPASLVLAGPAGTLLEELQAELSGETCRLYRNGDRLGVEIAGALKNIIGIAAGICDGLELGDNAKAALLTRGLVEITRFGVASGAQSDTFSGLAGIGDLITTSVSPHGRNRSFGVRLGKGETLTDILATTRKVAEGVWTCRAVLDKAAELGVDMPISEEVSQVLFDEKPAGIAVKDLMTRLLGEES